ncbi:hypothetical protein [Bradyrhizobium sp. 192]|uniref:hypothetical protein n=1 Tax=Bradyrhizobium sp. 192 TaxID=2782660 RepID=UPI001FFF451E|nr:hypothetical protein [Bradyrhizobium sp. 192]UPJ60207.1 hypothetical protein IVB24_11505 [Bradyrhizobium sp. 192]
MHCHRNPECKDELKHLSAKAEVSEKLILVIAAKTVRRFKQVWLDQKKTPPLDKKVVSIVDAMQHRFPIYIEL